MLCYLVVIPFQFLQTILLLRPPESTNFALTFWKCITSAEHSAVYKEELLTCTIRALPRLFSNIIHAKLTLLLEPESR